MRVVFVFSTLMEIVTKVDAHIGIKLSADFHEIMAKIQLITINKTGYTKEFAHFLSL